MNEKLFLKHMNGQFYVPNFKGVSKEEFLKMHPSLMDAAGAYEKIQERLKELEKDNKPAKDESTDKPGTKSKAAG
jgi:hypothetical protein